jgi:hypothetical protein
VTVSFTPTTYVAGNRWNVTTANSLESRIDAAIAQADADIAALAESGGGGGVASAFSPTYRIPQPLDASITSLPALLAYWRFNERSGTTIFDDLRSHDATGITPATAIMGQGGLGFNDGRVGLRVTTTGTIITVADQGANDTLRLSAAGGKSWSIGWIGRLDALPASGFVYVARKQSNGPGILINSTGSISVSWFDTVLKDLTTSTGILQPGMLTMIGATYDGATVRIYVNGRLQASSALADTGATSTSSWTMLASTTGTTPLIAHTAGIFVCGEAVPENGWNDLWSDAVGGKPVPLGRPDKVYRIAIDGAADLSNPAGDADRYGVIIVQPWRTTYRDAVKAANPNCKVICYQDVSALTAGRDTGSGLSSSLVNYDEAGNDPPSAANAAAGPNQAWFLRSTATGLPFTFNSYAFLWAADIGDPAFQARAAKNLRTLLEGSAWDGVFFDDVNPSITHHHTPSDVTEYPSDATYLVAMKSLMSRIAPVAESLGKFVVSNLPGHEFPLGAELLQEFTSGSDEMAFSFPTNTFQSAGTIDRAMRFGQEAQRRSLPILFGSATTFTGDVPQAQYARNTMAATLIVQEGTAYAGVTGNYSVRWWSPEWDNLDFLGAPVERGYRMSNGVWRRRYEGGIVYFNPTASGVALTFPGTFSGNGLTNSTGSTLAAQSSYILADS